VDLSPSGSTCCTSSRRHSDSRVPVRVAHQEPRTSQVGCGSGPLVSMASSQRS
jgi:hypothetical protein